MATNQIKKIFRKSLQEPIKNISQYLLLRAKGFEILTEKVKDERIKCILERFGSEEKSLAEFWLRLPKDIDIEIESKNDFLFNIKTHFILRILGPREFFIWTINGETDAIQNFEIKMEQLRDTIAFHKWKRMALDETLHLERLKKEFLGIKVWSKQDGGGVRDMIFGLNDGLVSTLAFVVGAYGAFMDSRIVLISGFAELLAGTISMAVSSYQSSKSEVEVIEKEKQKKSHKEPEQEKQQLVNFYKNQGFTINEAEAMANKIEEDTIVIKQRQELEKLGLSYETTRNPTKSGILCGLSFAIAALVPLFPFALPIESSQAVIISIIASIFMLFAAGCLKTVFSRKKWIKSGLEMMIIGIGAAGITYFIGTLFSLLV